MRCVLITLLFLMLVQTHLFSQNANVFENRIVLKHYTVQDLQQIQANDTLKFLYIKYFYIHSFTLQPVSCNDCPPYMPDLVDVSEYDYLRHDNYRVSYTDSTRGFKITLLSRKELEQLIKFGTITGGNDELKSIQTAINFPKYVHTGSKNDLQAYLIQIKDWINYNPIEYYQIKNNPDINIIQYSDFLNYSAQRKEYILQNTDRFIIIDIAEK